jgi:abequosyltransferase
MSTGRLAIAENEKSAALAQRTAAVHAEDPVSLIADLRTKANTNWMRYTYPFFRFGRRVSIHYSCDIRRSAACRIQVGDFVYIAPEAWLNIPEPSIDTPPAIVLGNGCKIGRRCMISAKNLVHLEDDVLLGPSVLITDHSHEFSNPELPIHAQGLAVGGRVHIERNCWLGYGASVVCTSGDLVVGRNSVVAANAVVTHSIPPFSVVAGNPAIRIRSYDKRSGVWVRAT